MARVALMLVVLSGLGAQGASGAALRFRDDGPVNQTVRGDGVRHLAYATDAGPVTIIDTITRHRSTVPSPAGCSLADMHRATLLWVCGGPPPLVATSGVTYDLAGGRYAALAPPSFNPSDGDAFQAIGKHWARVLIYGYHTYYTVYVDRVTGQERMPGSRRDRVADLDRTTLTRRLCAGQRLPRVPSDLSDLGLELGDLATAGPWAAATTYTAATDPPRGHVELQRCGATPLTLRACRTISCSQPVIDDRIVAWTESRPSKPGSGRLFVRTLETGKTRSAPIHTPATLELLGHRLFLASGTRLLRAKL